MRKLGVVMLSALMGWHIWRILQDYNADKAGVFILIVIALSMLVALYGPTRNN